MVGLNKFWFSILTLTMLVACVPEAKKSSSCGDGETVNVTLRTCVNANALARNNRPIPSDQAESLAEDVIGGHAFTLTPATDADGDSLRYLVVSDVAHGTITNCMNKSGSTGLDDRTCTYKPHSNYYGTDSFTYKVNDGFQDGSTYATVTFTITGVNDAPTVTSRYGVPIREGSVFIYRFNYTDPDNNQLADYCEITAPQNLAVTSPVVPTNCECDPLGVCSATIDLTDYLNSESTPAAAFSFDYEIGDNTPSGTLVSTETLYVYNVDDAPIISTPASCVGAQLTGTQEVAWSTTGCTTPPEATNRDYLNGDVLTYELVAGTNTCTWATLSTSGTTNLLTGVISGTPKNSDVGTCTLAYRVKDTGQTTSATYSFNLTIANAAPVLTDSDGINVPPVDLGTIAEDSAVAHEISISSDPACSATPVAGKICLTVDLVSDVTFTLNGAGTDCDDAGIGSIQGDRASGHLYKIFYTPAANFAGSCDIQIDVSDGKGGTDTLTGTVTVTPVDDFPTVAIANSTTPVTYSVFTGNTGALPNQISNASAPIYVDANPNSLSIEPFVIDQGGGDDEDTETMTVYIKSSNAALIPNNAANIVYYTDSSHSTSIAAGVLDLTYGLPFALTDPQANLTNLYLVLNPSPGQVGESTITLRLVDSTNEVTTKTFTVSVKNKSVAHRDWLNIKALGKRIDYNYDGTTATEEATVELKWNAFTVYNDTISGYLVYRSTSISGPFLTPLSTTPVSPSTRTYTDVISGAVAGTTYYYKVKAIATSNGKTMEPTASYSVATVKIPYENMAFMSRRIVNQSTCASMGKTPDPNIFNRCAYVGPGDNLVTGTSSGFFDIGADYFVDRYETSCNFTNTGCAGVNSTAGSCISPNDPAAGNPTTPTPLGIYYSRSSGKCFYTSNSGGAWTEIANLNSVEMEDFKATNQTSTSSILTQTSFPLRPPITMIQQHKAQTYCQAAPLAGVADAKILMSRIVHVAAADWGVTTSTSLIEEGFPLSLNNSQCNSSTGGSLSFDDDLIPTLIDTWTGTSLGTTPRSVMAGSNATASCQSRYGIQDLTGNVEEWNLDRFYTFDFERLNPLVAGVDDTLMLDTDGSNFTTIAYNPYQTIIKSKILTSMSFVDFEFKTGFSILTGVFLPVGLPTDDTVNSLSLAASTFIDNDDYVSLDVPIFTSTGDHSNTTIADHELSGIASGGHFEDGTKAGRYALRFKSVCHDDDGNGSCADPGDITANGTEQNVHTGFRCMMVAP